MKIRRLQRSDYAQVCELMIEFAEFTGIGCLKQEDYDREYAKNVLLRCEHTGASFVAEDSNAQISGMILSMRVPELWIPDIVYLREIAWYVKPNHRNSTVGARLYSSYKKAGENLQKQGKIHGFTMTKLANSPDFDYEKGGFRFIEATYLQGA